MTPRGPRKGAPAGGSERLSATDVVEPLEKSRLRAAFAGAVGRYACDERWHQSVAEALMAHLDPVRLEPRWILDAGTGTGTCSRLLTKRYPRARVIAADFVPGMLHAARRRSRRWFSRERFLCADAEALPLADASMDLLVSSLMLPFCLPPDASFEEFRRVLRPGGLLLFATLGPDTLKELRESWAALDRHQRVHRFLDMHDVGDALVRSGFADVVMDCERGVRHYADIGALLEDLRGIGAANAIAARARGLTGRGRLRAMAQAYESHRVADGLPASYEIVFGHAWRPERRAAEVGLGSVSVAPPRR